MKRWQNGELQQLFEEASTIHAKNSANTHNFKRSFRLCTLGRYSDAIRALEVQDFWADNDATFKKLVKLHPERSEEPDNKLLTTSLTITSNALVLDCLKSFPKGSAPGLDGFRAEHLIDALHSFQNNDMADLLTDLLNVIIAGKVHPEVRKWLGGGKLCAIDKKDGGIRPICMGSVLYGVDAMLMFYDRTIRSQEGTQQGDPLGPVLFALALKTVTDKLCEEVPDLLLNRWYLDDGYIAGKVKKVSTAYKVIVKTAAIIGLELRVDKSELFYPSGKVSRRDLFPADLKLKLNGVEVIGAPIGSKSFVSEFFDSQYGELKALLDRLREASSCIGTQATFTLLSKCISFCKMVFHARTVHPSLLIKHACDYDQLIQDCFLLLVPGITDQQLSQSRLPIRSGGLGLRRISDHLLPAFLSSASVAVKFLDSDLTKDYWSLKDMLKCFNAKAAQKLSWEEVGTQKVMSSFIDNCELGDFSSTLVFFFFFLEKRYTKYVSKIFYLMFLVFCFSDIIQWFTKQTRQLLFHHHMLQ